MKLKKSTLLSLALTMFLLLNCLLSFSQKTEKDKARASERDKPSTNIIHEGSTWEVPERKPAKEREIGNPGGGKSDKDGSKEILSGSGLSQSSIEGLKRLKNLSQFMSFLKHTAIGKLLLDLLENPSEVAVNQLLSAKNDDWKDLLESLSQMKQQEKDIANKILDDIEFQVDQELDKARANKSPNSDRLFREKTAWQKLNTGLSTLMPDFVTTAYDIQIVAKNSLPEQLVGFSSPGMENSNPGIYVKPFFRVKNVPFYGCKIIIEITVYVPNANGPFNDTSFTWYQTIPGLNLPNSPYDLTENHGLEIRQNFKDLTIVPEYFFFKEDELLPLDEGVYEFRVNYKIYINNKLSGSSRDFALKYEKW